MPWTSFATGDINLDGDLRADFTGDGQVNEKDSLEFYTSYDTGQYHKSAGTHSSRVAQGQYSGGSGYVDNRFGW